VQVEYLNESEKKFTLSNTSEMAAITFFNVVPGKNPTKKSMALNIQDLTSGEKHFQYLKLLFSRIPKCTKHHHFSII
jgi:hypothetical protein